MGIVDTLIESGVKVIAFLIGISLLIAGAQLANTGSQNLGLVMALIGIIVLVFAIRL